MLHRFDIVRFVYSVCTYSVTRTLAKKVHIRHITVCNNTIQYECTVPCGTHTEQKKTLQSRILCKEMYRQFPILNSIFRKLRITKFCLCKISLHEKGGSARAAVVEEFVQ